MNDYFWKMLLESNMNSQRNHENVCSGGRREAKGWELWRAWVQHMGRNPIGTLGVTKFCTDANDPQPAKDSKVPRNVRIHMQ